MKMNQATADFISQNAGGDVRQLAFLGKKYPEVDMPFALDQIRGRQMARQKLPRWAQTEGMLYPPHLSMEQCSSEQTARYKAELAASKMGGSALAGRTDTQKAAEENWQNVQFADLTGGFGVDFSYMAARLNVPSLYVERQEHLCEVARHNFALLGLGHARVLHGDGVEVLHRLAASPERGERGRLLFIDPARRDEAGNKVVSLKDCTPDVTLLAEEMLAKAETVIIKLSPMLDWHQAVSELPCVREVHIVSVGNECKELLLILQADAADSPLQVVCVNDGQRFVFGQHEAENAFPREGKLFSSGGSSMKYLYEPNASLMKAGCFNLLSERFDVEMLASNSHLFVSGSPVADFPGRSFEIEAVCSLNKKELRQALQGVSKANIATRNFPLSVAALRKRLKLKDGGDAYIFATTLQDGSHVLLLCKKERTTIYQ